MSVQHRLSNAAVHSTTRIAWLEDYLNPITTAHLRELRAPQPGARCLELGQGHSSTIRLLLDQVGPAGSVVAVDRDPSQLRSTPRLENVHHDLQLGLPMAGPFAFAHARLLLAQLPNRRLLLRQVFDVLNPGAWLVVGEFRYHQPLTVESANHADMEPLFRRVLDQIMEVFAAEHGVDLGWADHLQTMMAAAGLQRTKTTEYGGAWVGGSPGCRLLQQLARQQHGQLLAGGLNARDLQRFADLMSSPTFRCSAWPLVYARGQKPAAVSTIWVP